MWPKRKRTSPSKIERRLARLPYSEIAAWAETSLFTIGRGLRGTPDELADAEQNAEVLLAAIKQMRARR